MISSFLAFAIVEFYDGYVYVKDEMQTNLAYFSNAFESQINNTIEMMKVTDVPNELQKLPNDITGLMELSPNGSPISVYGNFTSSDYFRSTIYKFASLNGSYVSPLGVLNGYAVMNLAVKADDGDIIVMQVKPENFLSIGKNSTYLVDPTGLGVGMLSSGNDWENFTAFIANHSQTFVRWPNLIFKTRTYAGYSFVMFVPIMNAVYSTFVNAFLFYVLFIIVIIMLTSFHYFWFKTHLKPLTNFTKFIEKLDRFKKYEIGERVNFKMVDNYNKLVDETDKMSKSYANTIDEFDQVHTTFTNLDDLYSELPLIFERVENEDTFEDALKIISRRIIDASKSVNGVGIKYGQKIVTVGNITSYDFKNMNSKFHVEMKTGKSMVVFILDLDRLTETHLLKKMLNALFNQIVAMISIYELKAEGKKSARYDPLTELLTRQEFMNVVSREFERTKRDKQSISFIVMDIKNFKQFNQSYGHLEGDVLMKFISKVIKSNTRITDISCRWGEDEFAICFPDLKKENITGKIVNIRDKIKTFKREVTLKIGSAYYPQDGERIETIMEIAESRAKVNDI